MEVGVPEDYRVLFGLLHATWIAFSFAFGACAGSLINVLVYRLPRGLGVVVPASRCPACDTKLTWRENIPVLGWLMLQGRCRFCRSAISPEYPLVEAFVGALFAGLFALWFVVPEDAAALGVAWGEFKPEWALNGFGRVWPMFVMVVVLGGSLVAMTLIDARTFQIPLVLCVVPMALGVLGHGAHAAWVGGAFGGLRAHAEGHWWTIATPGVAGWAMVGAAGGGLIGLGVSNALLAMGLLRRSYADYETWEREALAARGQSVEALAPALPTPVGGERRLALPGVGRAIGLVVVCIAVLGALGGAVAGFGGLDAGLGVLVGAAAGPIAAGVLRRKLAGGPPPGSEPGVSGVPADMWIQYPHARREAMKELLFVAPVLALALAGGALAQRLGGPLVADPVTGQVFAATPIPLWASAMSGSVFGLLVGGGLVWGVRILGSLGFGKEAMGLGDVWLLAAVGACLGWIDATLTFFAAPFLALYATALQVAWAGSARRALPYGPYLAAGVLVVVLGKAWIEGGLAFLWAADTVDFP